MRNKSTMVELVAELKALPKKPAIDFLIREAELGEFHDYKNNKYVCGKVALVGYLDQLGLSEISQRVKNGEYDEYPDEDDKKALKEAALAGGFNVAQCRKLFGL